MRYTSALAAVAAVTPLVGAHGPALPKIHGLNPKDLRARDLLGNLEARFAEVHADHKLIARQDDRECGEGIGSCPNGQCCSGAGYCGTEDDYCYSPGCDYKHGPGCPENQTPAGSSTRNVPRPKVGSVPYGGAGIYNCKVPGTVAITYDDGPQRVLTAHVLDLMKSYDAKATFFITGNNINKGQIDITPEFSDVIKRQAAEGHQIASHTWTHLDLGAITTEERYDQMIKNEMALRNILGYIPTYMRPPYSSCAGQCEQDMADLGYHVTYFDIDTDDYNQDAPEKIQNAKDNFYGNITQGNASPQNSQWLEIGHDIHDQTVNNLTEYMLQTLTQLGYRGVTVGECLDDPKENWYREAGGAGSAPVASTTSAAPASTGTSPVSTDGQCGTSKDRSCLGSEFGNCCSSAGWCGETDAYCGNGCQSAFGNCGSNGNAPAAPAPTATRAATPSAAPAAGKVSTDGTCGNDSGFTCQGSSYGDCCSQYNWCGSTAGHCTNGCQSAFGTCN